MENYFKVLNQIDCSEHIEKKNGLSYLSWAWAWQELKKVHPDATYTIYENRDGWNYHTDGTTCWVKTGVTVNGIEHIEYLPVMDFKNRSIPVNAVTSFDVNKTIQRSLTKACARHGLGLFVYAGEDIPEQDTTAEQKPVKKQEKKDPEPAPAPSPAPEKLTDLLDRYICENCGRNISDHGKHTAKTIFDGTFNTYHKHLCWDCSQKQKLIRKAQEIEDMRLEAANNA